MYRVALRALLALAVLLVASPLAAQPITLGNDSPGLRVFGSGGGISTPVTIANGGCNWTSGGTTNTVIAFDGTRCVSTDSAITSILGGATSTGLSYVSGTGDHTFSDGVILMTPPAAVTTPGFAGSVETDSGINVGFAAGVAADFIVNNVHAGRFSGNEGLLFKSDYAVGWTSGAPTAATELVLYRSSATLVALASANAGTSYRDLLARSLAAGTATYGAAPIGTVGSGTGLTVNATGDYRRVVYKATCTQACFSAAATTADKTWYTTAAKQRITSIIADVTVAFTGGLVSDADMTCGTTAGGNEILATFDVDTAAITVGLADADLGTSMTRAAAIQGGYLPSWTTTTAVQCRLTTVGANTDQLTAGTIIWYLETLAM